LQSNWAHLRDVLFCVWVKVVVRRHVYEDRPRFLGLAHLALPISEPKFLGRVLCTTNV